MNAALIDERVDTVRFVVDELTRPLRHSVLAMRAAQMLERLDEEIPGPGETAAHR